MTELYPHQTAGIIAAVRRYEAGGRGQYLRWDPGMGKTLGTILLAKYLKLRNVGVIGPVVSLGVWEREIKKWYPEARGAVLRNGGGTSWKWLENSPCSFHITNYEQIRDNAEVRRNFLNFADLGKDQIDLLVLDEAQYTKSVSAQNTKAIVRIFPRFKNLLSLSGTPAHSPLDWYSQFKAVAPEDPYWAGQTFGDYKKRICILGGPNNNWVKGFYPHEVQEAARHVLPYCHVATSDQLQLPEPIWTPVTFKLEEDDAHAYREMDHDLEVRFDDGGVASADLVITKLLRLHQITGGSVTLEDGSTRQVGKSKLDALRQLLAERTGQKVVIACAFRWEVDAIANMVGYREGALGKIAPGTPLPNGKVSEGRHVALVITGDTAQQERSRIEELFQTSPHPIALIMQNRAGGMSLTLTAAKTQILYSFDPSVITFRQVWGRVWRIGQLAHVQILPLLAQGTVDEKMFDGLQRGLDGVDLARYALQGGSA